MIRTRDFLIYVLLLVFMVSSIGYTVIGDIDLGASKDAVAKHITFEGNEAAVFSARILSDEEHDRTTYIKRMQEKLAKGEGKIAGAPVVLTSSVPIEEEDSNNESRIERNVLWCTMLEQTEDIERTWNSADVEIYATDGVRFVTHTNTQDADSSLVSSLILPMLLNRAAHDTCLPHTIVGVDTNGNLIRNNDTSRFRMFDENTLIGYALDGFPIYGVSADESSLDSCGGVDTATGYRYHIRAHEDFVIGCFASPPAEFIRS